MFIRKKKIGKNEYAYLVENKYSKRKKQPRQKAKGYIGRVIKLERQHENEIEASSTREALIKELISHGFKEEGNKLTNNTLVVDLDSLIIKDKNKSVCLEINEGYLCNLTLKGLFYPNLKDLSEKEIIHKFAESFVAAGIKLNSQSFVSIYNSINLKN